MDNPPIKPFPYVYDSFEMFRQTLMNNLPNHYKQIVDAMTAAGSFVSCGVTELWSLIGSPEEAVNKIMKQRAPTDPKYIREAFVIFSDTVHLGNGDKLYKYIKEHNLGQIAEFGPRMNPNSGNLIKLWVWEPPHGSLLPQDKYLPVYGKRIVTYSDGTVLYRDDPEIHGK